MGTFPEWISCLIISFHLIIYVYAHDRVILLADVSLFKSWGQLWGRSLRRPLDVTLYSEFFLNIL